MKLISVMTACYNEEENIAEIYRQVKEVFQKIPNYHYEHIFIDNASKDRTIPILKEIAAADKQVKIIVNTRNFGHIRSPFYGLLQARGEAVISVVADLQDPPGLIRDFIQKWEQGYKIVVGVKKRSQEARWMFGIRQLFYNLIGRLSEIKQIPNFTGFGLYDRQVIEILKKIDDPYPYFRGLICDLGFEIAEIEYSQPARKKGRTKNNFYALFDMALLGITNHSKVPLRLATMLGFSVSIASAGFALGYFVYKLIYWNSFSVGIAPLVIGLFFFSAVQLFFVGIIGEYIGSIHTQVLKRPLVIEKERVNF
ncbi:dolichol monophosphate mannose synthase [candidate division WOR-1 bacterium RIFOXYB2_FULL_48_7]|uniref:Dolichol monophosphate mannose synthase n=1 Tax=candidate division WOR-1 bacterium RIFOXYB2_FULL_48_7 TaxID=1802583 RepID=A0A1F4TI06_UNCSA|nr:MAG: dolichol monophosphate mannose synthase [candidate division WOR-1 bacterium RIFOXYB2_FULL_48_7]